jgi:hypothetical protein
MWSKLKAEGRPIAWLPLALASHLFSFTFTPEQFIMTQRKTVTETRFDLLWAPRRP